MPRLKKIGNAFIQIVLLLSLIAITGHLAANYMQRQAIKNEISDIRNSLLGLKDTINNIGRTYDDMYKDVKSFVVIDNNEVPKDVNDFKISYKVAAESKLNKLFALESFDANIKEKDEIKFILPLVRNATTITRNSLKATGVGSESVKLPQSPVKRECKIRSNIHKCYRNFKTCS